MKDNQSTSGSPSGIAARQAKAKEKGKPTNSSIQKRRIDEIGLALLSFAAERLVLLLFSLLLFFLHPSNNTIGLLFDWIEENKLIYFWLWVIGRRPLCAANSFRNPTRLASFIALPFTKQKEKKKLIHDLFFIEEKEGCLLVSWMDGVELGRKPITNHSVIWRNSFLQWRRQFNKFNHSTTTNNK